VKFTDLGEITLSVSFSDEGGMRRVRVDVGDTGVGFDEATRRKLFERFAQADPTITRRFGGTGLGLAISRSLAELMGGEVRCVSQPGQGSVFTFECLLPRVEDQARLAGPLPNSTLEPVPAPIEAAVPAPVPPPVLVASNERPAQLLDDTHDLAVKDTLTAEIAPLESPPPPDATPSFDRLRVLVAEDNLVNQKVIQLLLDSLGVSCVLVANGALAVEQARLGGWDAIFMDLQMPVMDGLTAIAAIRAEEAQTQRGRTPIYAVTANAMPEHIRESMGAGADGHIAKPLSARALAEKLTVLAEERGLAEPTQRVGTGVSPR
jgi:CheY-like chemotaxis protein